MFLLNPKAFAKFYTIGSLMLIGSSTALIGIKKQVANIKSNNTRLTAATVYFVSLFITLYAALSMRSTPLTVLAVACQLWAALWYLLTYIPLGNTVFWKGMKAVLPF
eukprot:TRINITY_DN5320_c0_g1_i1.p1 TRINITY_DN5320_c0_g1~~TRINITY_DN5320_c0_g1_i1.p1  ORF type:complete len:107 (+),score=8.80 TRINITY_DN5320_c0_g1_i1:228-548(+)